jgi:dephospho-CoA kinase
MRVIGLTGSIGMGKSATAAMFRGLGVPVHDADAAVHRLYRGDGVEAVEALFPGIAVGGVVDRTRLAERVARHPEALKKLEAAVHPLVRASQDAFLAECTARGYRLSVLEAPLLFEAEGPERADTIVVVSAPADIQRARVLARPGMTEEKFAALLGRQLPDSDKRRRAHFVIDTGRGLPAAEDHVRSIVRALASAR